MECSDDGLDSDVLEDCQADDEVCVAGECSEPICNSGEQVCIGRSLYECNAIGAKFDRVSTCVDGSYCDPEIAACAPGKCQPNHKVCSQGGVVTCNVDGTAYENLVECGEDEACELGFCVSQRCEAGTSFCQDGHPFICDATGTVKEQADTCGGFEYCDAEDASCKPMVCMPQSETCVDNTLRRCNALGSSYTDQDCAEDICQDGFCWPKICEPGTYYCSEDGNAHQCYGDGTSAIVIESCTEFEECEVSADGSSASCVSVWGAGGAGG